MLYAIAGAASKGDKSEGAAAIWRQQPAHAATLERVRAAVAAADADADADAAAARLRDACSGSLAWTADDSRRNSPVATSIPHGILTYLRYRSRKSYSDGKYIGERLGDKLMYGLVMGSLFWGEGVRTRDPYHAANTTGVIWFSIILTGYGAAVYMPQLVHERPTFMRETADGCYRPVTFLLAKTLEEIVIILPFSLIYWAMLFYFIGFQGSFILTWLIF